MNDGMIKTRIPSVSEIWIKVGDFDEILGVHQQIIAIRLGLAPNDFKTHTKISKIAPRKDRTNAREIYRPRPVDSAPCWKG